MNPRQPSIISRVSASWKRYLPVAWTIGVGVGFSLTVFFVVRWWESQNVEKAFRLAAEDRATAVKGTFETELAMLELICSSLMADGLVGRDEFREILAPFLSRSHSIQAVEWVPRVPNNRRLEYEAAARRDGLAGFQFTELDGDGRMVSAARRDEYFPIYFIGPRPGDKTVYGYDIASEPIRQEALQMACDTGQTVASGLIAFVEDTVEDTAETYGFLVYLPIYKKDARLKSVADRRKNFLGVLLGVFRPDEMLETALAKLQPEGIDVCLYDPSVPAQGNPFHFHASRTRKQAWQPQDQSRLYDPKVMHYLARLDVAGHPWTIVCIPISQFVATRMTWWPCGVLAVGLVLTAMLAAYMSASIDRRAYVEQLLLEKRRYAGELEQKVRAQTAHIRRAQEEVIYRLASASRWRDEETGMHIRRTGLLSESLARAAGWSAAEAEVIRLAAPMHDVGKIGIPDAVLRKPGKLTAEEFEVMKTHTLIGAEILAGSSVSMLQMARQIALNHHERWDGKGYPNGLAGQDVPECARIVAIVDAYDALTHDRVYRAAQSEDEALEIMRQEAGRQFDPLLLSCFFMRLSEIRRILEEHPDEPLVDKKIGATLALGGKKVSETVFR